LTTGTSIHANSTIYIHHSSLHKKWKENLCK
jgi:hypothetical protein